MVNQMINKYYVTNIDVNGKSTTNNGLLFIPTTSRPKYRLLDTHMLGHMLHKFLITGLLSI